MNAILETIARRRSCRQFRPDPLPMETLQAIIDAGLQAPTGHNDQSVYLVVVNDAELIQQLSDGSKAVMQTQPLDWMAQLGCNPKYHIYYKAPTVVVVSALKEAISPVADVCASIQNMLLAATSLEVGSCWIGFTRFFFQGPEHFQRLGIPPGYDVHYGVALGYPAGALSAPAPARKHPRYFHLLP